jgi:4a-hydroxytetrahydrobiopterin dehydratase
MMNELARMHCTRNETNTPPLNNKEIGQLAGNLPGWQVVEKGGQVQLERSFKFENFRKAMDFSDQVARVADEEDHHPAILTEWGKVTISWWSHRIKGLHRNDFIMAAKTSEIHGDRNGTD